jgi:hypothetical protein
MESIKEQESPMIPRPKFPWGILVSLLLVSASIIIFHTYYTSAKKLSLNNEHTHHHEHSSIDSLLFNDSKDTHLRSDPIKFIERFDGSLTIPMVVFLKDGFYNRIDMSFQNGTQDSSTGALLFEVLIKPEKALNDTIPE